MSNEEQHAQQDHDTTKKAALDILLNNLRSYGNTPSQAQASALEAVLSHYTETAEGRIKGRYAFPLPPGVGKTQSIIAWCAARHRLGLLEEVGVVACASKVEALCDLKRNLMEHGIPEESIGLIHSYSHNPKYDPKKLPDRYASLPSTGQNDQKPILLVTHSRVRGVGGIEEQISYQGQRRKLVIWDESLIVSQPRSLKLADLKFTLSLMKAAAEGIGDTRKAKLKPIIHALAFVEKCIDRIETEMRAQRNGLGNRDEVNFPKRSGHELNAYRQAIINFKTPTSGATFIDTEPLERLLDFATAEVRVVNATQGGGLITYDIVVHPSLENIVILDASNLIRDLVKMDKTIHTGLELGDDSLVDYSSVNLNFLRHRSGRGFIEEEYRKRKSDRVVSDEIAEVVKSIPEDEGVIIFTFKHKGGRQPDVPKELYKDLQAHGIDMGKTIPTPSTRRGRPRFVFLTWGSETSLSQFSYCKNVIFVGVIERAHIDIISAIAGQKDDIDTKPTTDEVKRVILSESSHSVYQGMCRGSCRIVDNGTAKPMRVWLFYNDVKIIENIKKVMPGVVVGKWTPKWMAKKETKTEHFTMLLEECIMELPEDLDRISSRKLKASMEERCGAGVKGSTFQRALASATEYHPEWVKDGASIQRKTATYYGFTE